MDCKLSILVCSTHNRYATFLPKILAELFAQAAGKPVEVTACIDNKAIMLGDKRTNMVRTALGEYVAFVDDDDRVAPNYIDQLLLAIDANPDIITFKAAVSMNGGPPKDCIYSKDIDADFNTPECYYRLPNHICCVKWDIAFHIPFLPVLYGEDSDYSKRLKPALQTEVYIPQVLYFYDYNILTTETQTLLGKRKSRAELLKHLRNG